MFNQIKDLVAVAVVLMLQVEMEDRVLQGLDLVELVALELQQVFQVQVQLMLAAVAAVIMHTTVKVVKLLVALEAVVLQVKLEPLIQVVAAVAVH